MKPFFVYLLRCADSSFYAGHTDDLDDRLRQHQTGTEGYTASRKPVELVWQGEFESREGALAFERQIKGWSRAKKEALMRGDWDEISQLAKSRTAMAGLRQAQPEGSKPTGVLSSAEESFDKLRTNGWRDVNLVTLPTWFDQIFAAAQSPLQRRAIAKAITLLESTRPEHRAQADELLNRLLPHTGDSFRLGISGVPGVGKSTFIEALGLHLIGLGHRVAVLAVDPSSSVSGGSILGDKTRMEQLSVHPQAYIRPSPSSGTLGGVAERTREAMLVCEAAGYDVVIVETVGVGQSETAVQGMTDMFCLLQLPNAGDDLQAIKKGVMELADLVVINKADLDENAATRARAQISSALRLFGLHGHPDHAHHDQSVWHPTVIQMSALKNQGVDAFWTTVSQFRDLQSSSGRLAARRRSQDEAWMWERIDAGLKARFKAHPAVREQIGPVADDVRNGVVAASVAARRLLDLFH